MSKENVILEMKNITKVFPGVKALDRVNLTVRKGTVHGLMGENGAGKSTLMKVLMGIHEPENGEVIFKGEQLKFADVNNSLEKGISMIHQELSPVPYTTIAENIFLGREPTYGFGVVNHKKLFKKTKDLFEDLNIDLNPKTKMKDLSIADMQMVEIAKAISYNADLIIMDEPTSAITDKEVDHLFKMIRNLKEKGVAVIYITHKMEEVFQITDEVTVLRDGEYIGTEMSKNINSDQLITMMVGRELGEVFIKEESEIKDVLLSAKHLSKEGEMRETTFKDVSFDVKEGEILGFSGLVGSGRSEVMEALFGITNLDSGKVYIRGEEVEINSPNDAIRNKLALLTEDRKSSGLYLPLAVDENMISASVDKFISKNFIDNDKVERECQELREKLNIKTPSLTQIVGNLSGGNQQKVLIARWLLTDPDILILDEPTRGIDVGAKSEIHKLMSALAQSGKAIIMISSEMPEILGMSDRIVVMHEGQKMGELTREEATQEKIMKLASGNMKEAI
jgi:inositol transport system ATP-binding protein